MTAQKQAVFWGAAFAGFLGFVFLFKAILLPFVLGFAIAYLLNPMVNALGRAKINRSLAALIILGTFILLIIALIAALAPVVYRELIDFSEDLPGYGDRIWALLEPLSIKAQEILGVENGTDLKALLGEYAGTGVNVAKRFAISIAAGGQAVLDLITVMIFTPVVAYFMMKEWPRIWTWVEGLMPRENKDTIKKLLNDIDAKLSGFVRGQITVAVFLGIAYAIALSIAGLKYSVLIGLSAGLLSIIPMVGSTVGLLVSVGVAWFQAGEWSYVAIIAGIFVVGQIVEGNFITPKIVGDSVGLHPLWIFFALLAGASLFGVVGMLLAVPVAAVAGVLLAFGITQYKASSYFKGRQKTPSQKRR